MLSRCPFYSCTARSKPFDFCSTNLKIIILLISLSHNHKAVLSATVPIVPARKTYSSPNRDLCIIMGTRLIFPEKFKSISGTLSPLKPRNVSNGISCPSLLYYPTTFRAIFIRQVKARTDRTIIKKLGMFTVLDIHNAAATDLLR